MYGLYALKPWYGHRLAGLRRVLIAHRVAPNAVTSAGVVFGAGAGLVLAVAPVGPWAAVVVAILLLARLGCANLDGGLARATGRGTRFGVVVNELGDRLAELAALAGLFALAPPALVLGAALATTAPSWVALAGTAAFAPRSQGGPVGKTERCALLVVIAATGWVVPVVAVLIGGSVLTAGMRLHGLRRQLAAS